MGTKFNYCHFNGKADSRPWDFGGCKFETSQHATKPLDCHNFGSRHFAVEESFNTECWRIHGTVCRYLVAQTSGIPQATLVFSHQWHQANQTGASCSEDVFPTWVPRMFKCARTRCVSLNLSLESLKPVPWNGTLSEEIPSAPRSSRCRVEYWGLGFLLEV